MSIIIVVLFSVIYVSDSSLPSNTTLATSRVKRNVWMENGYYADESYRAEGSKYSWVCRECSLGFHVWLAGGGSNTYNLCELEAEWNNEPIDAVRICTAQEVCEKLSKTDPDESVHDTWGKGKFTDNLSAPPTTPGQFAVHIHRACCEKFGICDLKLGASGTKRCEEYSSYPGQWLEVIYRSCCRTWGLFCDVPVRVPNEGQIQRCNQADGCTGPEGVECCVHSNVTCTIPECGENDVCLTGFDGRDCLGLEDFGACCEFYNKCDGPLCATFIG